MKFCGPRHPALETLRQAVFACVLVSSVALAQEEAPKVGQIFSQDEMAKAPESTTGHEASPTPGQASPPAQTTAEKPVPSAPSTVPASASALYRAKAAEAAALVEKAFRADCTPREDDPCYWQDHGDSRAEYFSLLRGLLKSLKDSPTNQKEFRAAIDAEVDAQNKIGMDQWNEDSSKREKLKPAEDQMHAALKKFQEVTSHYGDWNSSWNTTWGFNEKKAQAANAEFQASVQAYLKELDGLKLRPRTKDTLLRQAASLLKTVAGTEEARREIEDAQRRRVIGTLAIERDVATATLGLASQGLGNKHTKAAGLGLTFGAMSDLARADAHGSANWDNNASWFENMGNYTEGAGEFYETQNPLLPTSVKGAAIGATISVMGTKFPGVAKTIIGTLFVGSLWNTYKEFFPTDKEGNSLDPKEKIAAIDRQLEQESSNRENLVKALEDATQRQDLASIQQSRNSLKDFEATMKDLHTARAGWAKAKTIGDQTKWISVIETTLAGYALKVTGGSGKGTSPAKAVETTKPAAAEAAKPTVEANKPASESTNQKTTSKTNKPSGQTEKTAAKSEKAAPEAEKPAPEPQQKTAANSEKKATTESHKAASETENPAPETKKATTETNPANGPTGEANFSPEVQAALKGIKEPSLRMRGEEIARHVERALDTGNIKAAERAIRTFDQRSPTQKRNGDPIEIHPDLIQLHAALQARIAAAARNPAPASGGPKPAAAEPAAKGESQSAKAGESSKPGTSAHSGTEPAEVAIPKSVEAALAKVENPASRQQGLEVARSVERSLSEGKTSEAHQTLNSLDGKSEFAPLKSALEARVNESAPKPATKTASEKAPPADKPAPAKDDAPSGQAKDDHAAGKTDDTSSNKTANKPAEDPATKPADEHASKPTDEQASKPAEEQASTEPKVTEEGPAPKSPAKTGVTAPAGEPGAEKTALDLAGGFFGGDDQTTEQAAQNPKPDQAGQTTQRDQDAVDVPGRREPASTTQNDNSSGGNSAGNDDSSYRDHNYRDSDNDTPSDKKKNGFNWDWVLWGLILGIGTAMAIRASRS